MAGRRWFMGHIAAAPLVAKDAALAPLVEKRVVPRLVEYRDGDIVTAEHLNAMVRAIKQLQELHRVPGKH